MKCKTTMLDLEKARALQARSNPHVTYDQVWAELRYKLNRLQSALAMGSIRPSPTNLYDFGQHQHLIAQFEITP